MTLREHAAQLSAHISPSRTQPLDNIRLQLLRLALLVAVPIHIWSYYNVLRELPAWLYRLDRPDLMITLAATQCLALAETLLVALPLLLIQWLLPIKRVQIWLIAVYYLVAGWSVIGHLNIHHLRNFARNDFIVWGSVVLLSLLIATVSVQRSAKVRTAVDAVASRLVVLSAFYLLLDLISVMLVALSLL